MTELLSFLAAIVGSYDVALVVLALLAYLILAPFSYRGQRTIYQIQKSRPAIEKLKGQFNDDKAKLNRAIMALYKERNINPIGVFVGWVPQSCKFC
jgi:YidC/Oxa1 family membrane protein insertase